MIRHQDVQSSTIRSIGYDPEEQTLHVSFKSGGDYVYHDVPPEKHEAFMLSGSKGIFLHQNIKGQHDHTKL